MKTLREFIEKNNKQNWKLFEELANERQLKHLHNADLCNAKLPNKKDSE